MSSANWNGHSSSDSSFTDHTSAAAAVVVSSTTTGKESIMQAGTAELQTLLEIENDPILKLQLRNWEEQAASISRRIERKENRTYVVKNEIYQVLGFYIVFQGVVLTAVAQASALTCRQWWSPFTLSLIASIVTIVGVYQKLQVLHDVEQNLREERNSFQVIARNIQLFKKKGTKFNFAEDVKRGEPRAAKTISVTSLVFSSNFVVFLSLLAFSVVILVSCNTILCKVLMNG
ncbi:unnamed protein product [Sphagnum troendelagicum]|uniref:SMODS and SLOG-associating 2TM effector domain-containing protein n=1 Tax=Sphagnum troendelagicum TaxID=128251 RepID=A0ABP0UG98_9BRYO